MHERKFSAASEHVTQNGNSGLQTAIRCDLI
jgi:hypothetical protein